MLSAKFITGALVGTIASLSQAVPLTPGAWTNLPGITTIPGTVVQDINTPFSFSAYGGLVSGSVQSRVTLKADNTYLFEWRVFSDAASAGAIQDLRLASFHTGLYDGDWESAGLGDTNPTRAFLFTGSGGKVNFNFQGVTSQGLLAGHTSFFFFLNTNATSYDKTAQYDLTNAGQTQNSGLFPTFAPVPEPACLTCLALGALGLVRRRGARRV